jgi:hypothetical protein
MLGRRLQRQGGVDMRSVSVGRYQPRLSRSVKVLGRWRPVLAEHTDSADQLIAAAQRRLPDLAAEVPVPSSFCRGLLEGAILPGAALYLELLDRVDRDRALSLTGACIATDADRRARVRRRADRTPWLFPIFRRMMRWAVRHAYVPPAWEAQMLEDTPRRVHVDITRCYYLDTLTTLGVPELTARYCANDDIIWGHLLHIEFHRTGTLGYGHDKCDFDYQVRHSSKPDHPNTRR